MDKSKEHHLLFHYYGVDNDGSEDTFLQKIVNKKIAKFGGIDQVDMQDFYSIANECFVRALQLFDSEKSNIEKWEEAFANFLGDVLDKKIKTEMTRRNRSKRRAIYTNEAGEKVYLKDEQMDAPIVDGEVETFGDRVIDTSRSVEESAMDNCGAAARYLDSLTSTQRKIVELRMQGYTNQEIAKMLGIRDSEFTKQFYALKDGKKIKVLLERGSARRDSYTSNDTENKEKVKENKAMIGNSREKTKKSYYAVEDLINQVNENYILVDCAIQRAANQWTTSMKSGLISTILNLDEFNPIILCEQVSESGSAQWLIDGLQRVDTLNMYINNGFKISKNVERPIITYRVPRERLNADGSKRIGFGSTPCEEDEYQFDIRGKKYCDLPDALQTRIRRHMVPFVLYLNCTNDDIEYHMRRYNHSVAMRPAQSALTYLGTELSYMIKAITENHTFFNSDCPYTSFTAANHKNGIIERVIMESIMATCFLEDWKKKPEQIGDYLKSHADQSHFDYIQSIIERLEEVADEKVAKMWNSTDTYMWFTLFDRFIGLELPDERFTEFMKAFDDGLKDVKIDGVAFSDLKKRGTKDASVVSGKIDYLEELMERYFNGEFDGDDDTHSKQDDEPVEEADESWQTNDDYNELVNVIDENDEPLPFAEDDDDTYIKEETDSQELGETGNEYLDAIAEQFRNSYILNGICPDGEQIDRIADASVAMCYGAENLSGEEFRV